MDGWQVGFRKQEDALIVHNTLYLTQPAAVNVALAMASAEMQAGRHARVLLDGDGDVLCDFEPKKL